MQGPGPSARYAHTLALVANRFLVAMGGNDGKQTLSDAWALDTSDKPYQWRKITDAGETPSPRWLPELAVPLCIQIAESPHLALQYQPTKQQSALSCCSRSPDDIPLMARHSCRSHHVKLSCRSISWAYVQRIYESAA